jgi:hypothetical protein
MIKIVFFILSLSLTLNGRTQNRELTWVLGSLNLNGPEAGLDFSSGSLQTITMDRTMWFFFTNASICDTFGNLLFYTNGNFIANQNNDSLQNTFGFNPGYTTNAYLNGMPITQGCIVLPKGDSSNEYYLFHESADQIFPPTGYDENPVSLRYSVIDMDMDGGLGGIDSNKKSIIIINDTLTNGRLTACKHANGRDWWLISHEYYRDKYYKLLVTPDSIYGPYEQVIGSNLPYDIFGMSIFSPEGTRFVMLSPHDSVDVLSFDRCTGDFSNHVLLEVPDSSLLLGCAISANSRFLYVSSYLNVFQYDLEAADISQSVIHVAHYDTSQTGLARYFTIMQLAPDNKIYISTYNSTTYLHAINYPDSLGLACDLVQSAVILPAKNAAGLPNFPNYDLGILQGSPCDTIVNIPTGLQLPNSSLFKISPNPATSWLNIVYETSADGLFELFDINGKRVAATSLYHYFKNRLVDVSKLPAGVYLATVTQNGKQVWKEKVIIVRS